MKNKKSIRKVLALISIAVVVILIAGAIYINDYYHADAEALAAFTATETVETYTEENGNVVYKPDDMAAGLIFYPGGKVEHTAYIPLMQKLASEGILCVLVKMPFNLAVMDIDAADGIQEQFPEVENWYIGGHSLGGSMAAAYLEDNFDSYEGLILLGSYSTTDLTDTDLDVISIYGSEDTVLNQEKYAESKLNLPDDFVEIVIDGGCHAYFGTYGAQDGDGKPSISNEEQINITADAITDIIN